MDGAEPEDAASRPVAMVQLRWFIDDDASLRWAVDLDAVATEMHERHRLWLATELARISRNIVDGVRAEARDRERRQDVRDQVERAAAEPEAELDATESAERESRSRRADQGPDEGDES